MIKIIGGRRVSAGTLVRLLGFDVSPGDHGVGYTVGTSGLDYGPPFSTDCSESIAQVADLNIDKNVVQGRS